MIVGDASVHASARGKIPKTERNRGDDGFRGCWGGTGRV